MEKEKWSDRFSDDEKMVFLIFGVLFGVLGAVGLIFGGIWLLQRFGVSADAAIAIMVPGTLLGPLTLPGLWIMSRALAREIVRAVRLRLSNWRERQDRRRREGPYR